MGADEANLTPEPVPPNQTLAAELDRHTIFGALWGKEDCRVRCVACGHRCLLADGQRGICKVRFNQGGRLRVPFGYLAGLQCDPVEKKPFYHVYPGSDALTFGMLGCDFHCAYCQNWVTSQTLRNPASIAPIQPTSPEEIVHAAKIAQARLLVSSYNEPLITAEWAAAIFQKAKQEELACAFVSNGHATPEAVDYLSPWLRACKIDLKSFNEQHYHELGGRLKPVLDTIASFHQRGVWVEVVTLLVPGFNDSETELRSMARFIAGVSPGIPWHITAFHPDYNMTENRSTSPADLVRAAEIGVAEGLQFVYAGNAPGRVGEWENTRCPRCAHTLIRRRGFSILSNTITAEGACSSCGQKIPGVF